MLRSFAGLPFGLGLALLLAIARPAAAQSAAHHPAASPPTDTTAAPRRISAGQAKKCLGQRVTVTAKVVRVHTADYKKGSPTFLNLAKPFPNCPLEIVIFTDLTSRLPLAAADLVGRSITVTGTVERFGGVINIVLTDARQLILAD